MRHGAICGKELTTLFFFQVYKCDLVLLAMGFLGPEKYISSELDLTLDPRSNYHTPSGRYCTSVPKVFAAGGTVLFVVSLYCREDEDGGDCRGSNQS